MRACASVCAPTRTTDEFIRIGVTRLGLSIADVRRLILHTLTHFGGAIAQKPMTAIGGTTYRLIVRYCNIFFLDCDKESDDDYDNRLVLLRPPPRRSYGGDRMEE